MEQLPHEGHSCGKGTQENINIEVFNSIRCTHFNNTDRVLKRGAENFLCCLDEGSLTTCQENCLSAVDDQVPIQCTEDWLGRKTDMISDTQKVESSSHLSGVQVADSDIDLPHPFHTSNFERSVSSPSMDQTGLCRSQQFVDEKQIRLKYADEEKSDKKQPHCLGEEIHDTQPLSLEPYLKNPYRTVVYHHTRHVFMLHFHKSTFHQKSSLPAKDSSSLPGMDYNSELIRLGTYSKMENCVRFLIPLARVGFVYHPNSNSVRCFFCNFKVSETELRSPGIEPIILHSEKSPGCPIINGSHCKNIPVPQNPVKDPLVKTVCSELKIPPVKSDNVSSSNSSNGDVSSRYTTPGVLHHSASSDATVSVPQIQAPDLSVTGTSNQTVSSNSTTSSFQCQLSATVTQTSQSRHTVVSDTGPKKKNKSDSSPTSNKSKTNSQKQGAAKLDTATEKSSGNKSPASLGDKEEVPKEKKKVTYSELGIFAEKAKRTDMGVLQKRLASFEGKWKNSYAKTAQELAEAGMYYAGYSDCARCFFCGGGLKNWESPDEPWVEHARWFPKCVFVHMTKGAMFVEIVQQKSKKGKKFRLEDVEEEMRQRTQAEKVCATTPLPVSVLVYPASSSEQSSSVEVTAADLAVLEQEHEEFLSIVTCKICMDEKSNVVFLPCGHMVACTTCALVLKVCPLCRADIKGSVKASMG